ncbi:MAG TPA: T9SS type A sorting domain-containing protein [Chitinophagales bacterium]|nr:T9SS type A sorting domain-containing protein [Chitinophagales bacterium]HRG87102.1 T9SS type A sorting domain-containing protein [Chitinophagales bacterium]HRH53621.1 T9SS type A sorting domain-containing protein [Chitinophagales bacterium]
MHLKNTFLLSVLFGATTIFAQPSTELSIPQLYQAEQSGSLHFRGKTKAMRETKENTAFEELFMDKRKHEDEARERSAYTVVGEPDYFVEDPALQKDAEIATTDISILSNWEGLKSKYLRSDNNIAVGPNHVVQMINSALFSSYIRVWNKTGDILINKANMYDLVGEPDYGDPNIIYDEKADRWVITFLYSDSDARLIIMASVTNDPTGEWYYYDFETTGGFPDYEKVAVWGNSYVVTTAQANPNVYLLNRESILNGTGASPVIKFLIPKFKNIGWQAASPVQQTGSIDLPEGEPAIIWRVWDNWWHPPYSAVDQLELFELDIDWATPLAATMTGPIALPIEVYNSNLCGINSNTCLEQPGTTVRLWPLSNFITDKSKYMNFGDYQSIVGVHVCRVNEAGTAGQRWYELRKYPGGEWYVYQQGTYSPTADHRFIGSISINEDGTIALGYNITSSTVYPGMRMTGRAVCDPINLMTAPEAISKNGTASNKTLDYGDYNSLVTDPVDGSFWFSGQYNVSNKWSSNVVHFTVDGCLDEKSLPLQNTSLSDLTISPIPASNLITVGLQSDGQSTVAIQIYDMSGKLVLQKSFMAGIGKNTFSFYINELAIGAYVLNAVAGDTIMHKNFIVER